MSYKSVFISSFWVITEVSIKRKSIIFFHIQEGKKQSFFPRVFSGLYYCSAPSAGLWKSLAESETFSSFWSPFIHNTETTVELLVDIHPYLPLANANMFYTLHREGMVTWDDIETTAESPKKRVKKTPKTIKINRKIT